MGGRDVFARMDARIDNSRIGYMLLLGGSTRIPGHFFREPRLVESRAGNAQGVDLSFDCQYVAAIGALSSGDAVEIEDVGRFRFLNEVDPGGDDSGMTTIVLGSLK